MKNNKGISIISLIVTIVVIIILVGIATTAGYRYITESDRAKASAVVSVISEAAYRRQNDLTTGVANAYYEGYSFDVYNNKEKYDKITGLPEEMSSGDPDVPDCLEEDGSKWYLFDAESASALGVRESERYIERNISYLPGNEKNEITLVLADYTSGKGFLIDMPENVLKDSIRQEAGCLNSPNGNHDYKIIATCTRPATCIYCGGADPANPALGHDYTPPTCTSSGICRRCDAVDPDNGPLGHLMITNNDLNNEQIVAEYNKNNYKLYTNDEDASDSTKTAAWVTDALKHWHECIRCGERSNETEHKKGNVPVDAVYHYTICSECGWESIKTFHVFSYQNISATTHKKICKVCLYEEIHTDSGWIATHPDVHYKICDETDKCHDTTITVDGVITEVLFAEKHYDYNEDLYCDLCGAILDFEPPNSFEDENTYAKMIAATTNSITVEAFTIDEGMGIDYYQFGILNTETGQIEWSEVIYPVDGNTPVTKTFEGLKADTEYNIYVKATDKAGNYTPSYKIPDTRTKKMPEFVGLTNIPENYVQGPIFAGIKPIDTQLTDLTIKYSLDNGNTWSSIPIANISVSSIKLTKESETVQAKVVDSIGNESDIWIDVIEKIDLTPPKITIEAKEGDNNEQIASVHMAKVTISDIKAGIAPDTEVRYAWSTSNTEVPKDFDVVYTKNMENVSRTSFEIATPPSVYDKYYLWILEGVEDSVGNPTTQAVCSGITFNVDDVEVQIVSIEMVNLSPAVDSEYLFVKTEGIVTIFFETNKKLGEEAVVTLNNQKVEVEAVSDLEYMGTIKITEKFEEGVLELKISNVVSETGKVSKSVYTNEDITGRGPVIYDKTLPVIEYISKQ